MDGVFNSITDFEAEKTQTHLKDMLFKIAECHKIPINQKDWVAIDQYNEEEKYWNSSIFLEEHLERLASDELSKFATVSSTILMVTENDQAFMYERVYKHGSMRKKSDE